MAEREKRKAINTDQVVSHLTRVFERVTYGMERAKRSLNQSTGKFEKNELYELQVEFMYYINDIQRGANYIVPKAIAGCNEFLDEIMKRNKK